MILRQYDRLIQYALLSRIFQNQLAMNDLPAIRSVIETMSQELQENYQPFLKEAEKGLRDKETEQALQVEYAHIFLLPEGVKPFESVYRSSERMLHQKPWQDVKRFYNANGFMLSEGEVHPEDHISVELAFMSGLIEEGDKEAVQRLFLSEHLLQWFPELLEDIIKNPHASFYRKAAVFAQQFIGEEQRRLSKLS